MGSAQQFVYRFDGDGERGEQKVFDKNGDIHVPVQGDVISLDRKDWKVVTVEKEHWGSVPAYIIYVAAYL